MTEAAARIIQTTRELWETEAMILNNDQLKDLTGGLVQGAAQRRWIQKQLGIAAPIKIDGHPMITWAQINTSLADGGKRRAGPKWSVAA